MSVYMDEALSQMSLKTLADQSTAELQRCRKSIFVDDGYCVELFRRALTEQTDEIWSVLQHCFSNTVRAWIRSHPYRDVALLRDSEENYTAQTFTRFWYAVHDQRLEFTSLNAALSYLHATLNGVLMDTLRSYLRFCLREVPLPVPGLCDLPCSEELLESQDLWESLQKLLLNKREKRIFYLLYYCGLKPREVIISCPGEFANVQEIYRLNTTIIDRLRRNRERVRYLLGSEQ